MNSPVCELETIQLVLPETIWSTVDTFVQPNRDALPRLFQDGPRAVGEVQVFGCNDRNIALESENKGLNCVGLTQTA